MDTTRQPAVNAPSQDWFGGVQRGLLIAAAVGVLVLPPEGRARMAPPATVAVAQAPLQPAPAVEAAAAVQANAARRADFGDRQPSGAARDVADWSLQSGDHQGLPFVIVDKHDATVYVFEAQGRLAGASPVLLGAATGDDSVPGIGDRPIPLVKPEERTTPAGRFIGERGSNTTGEDVVWVDYDAAVSMHRVRPLVAAERRLERLASESPLDNRISYGCINVPVAFFESRIEPLFRSTRAVIYVLPETRPVQAAIPSFEPPTAAFAAHTAAPPDAPQARAAQ